MGNKNKRRSMYRDIYSAGVGMEHNGAHGLVRLDCQLRLTNVDFCCVYLVDPVKDAIAGTCPIIALKLQ